MSAALDLEGIAKRHRPDMPPDESGFAICVGCDRKWPCDAASLLAAVGRETERAMGLLRRWRDAALEDDAGTLVDLTAETTDLLGDGEP